MNSEIFSIYIFFLVNKESWGKYDEQKNALGEAIMNGERELQAIVEVNSK